MQIQRVNELKVLENVVDIPTTYGIYISDCDGHTEINKNQVHVANGYGIYIQNSNGGTPPATQRILVSNNFISTQSNNTYSFYLYNCTNLDVLYNSVYTYGGTSGSVSFYTFQGTDTEIKNNNFVNTVGGYSMYIQNSSGIQSSDHNNLFTTGTTLAFWDGDQVDLAALQSASGMDGNSVSLDPAFISTDSYKFSNDQLDSVGTPHARVLDDIEGSARGPVYTTIGAWKYDPNVLGIDTDRPLAIIPKTFVVDQNYPNPFNPVTRIRFGVPSDQMVKIEIFNLLGQQVAIISNEMRKAGYHTITIDASAMASGLYFYLVSGEKKQIIKKMMVVK